MFQVCKQHQRYMRKSWYLHQNMWSSHHVSLLLPRAQKDYPIRLSAGGGVWLGSWVVYG